MDTFSMQRGFTVPSVVTGKPIAIGGSVGRSDATGRGVMIATRESARLRGVPFAGSRIAIQGFGNVGEAAARLLHEQGCRIVAVSDISGGCYDPGGLDPRAVLQHMRRTGTVMRFPGSEAVSSADLLELPCDVLIPAAIEGQITRDNASRVQAPVIVEAANGPTTPEADAILVDRKVLVIPDILANAGGVTVSYFEWVQDLQAYFWTEQEINDHLERIMVSTFGRVATLAATRHITLRTAALIVAVERVAAALMTRGIYP
jgi:glutamate dehydrogenase (NAD(P)+)